MKEADLHKLLETANQDEQDRLDIEAAIMHGVEYLESRGVLVKAPESPLPGQTTSDWQETCREAETNRTDLLNLLHVVTLAQHTPMPDLKKETHALLLVKRKTPAWIDYLDSLLPGDLLQIDEMDKALAEAAARQTRLDAQTEMTANFIKDELVGEAEAMGLLDTAEDQAAFNVIHSQLVRFFYSDVGDAASIDAYDKIRSQLIAAGLLTPERLKLAERMLKK